MNHEHVWETAAFDPRYQTCVDGCNVLRRTPTALDTAEAKKQRDEAVENVELWADPNWVDGALTLGRQIAKDTPEFTSDELWRRGLPKPREPRALGPVMSTLAREGFIEPTDRLVNTEQVLRHAAPVRVWRSRVYRASEVV
jgi:hypothetical protein